MLFAISGAAPERRNVGVVTKNHGAGHTVRLKRQVRSFEVYPRRGQSLPEDLRSGRHRVMFANEDGVWFVAGEAVSERNTLKVELFGPLPAAVGDTFLQLFSTEAP